MRVVVIDDDKSLFNDWYIVSYSTTAAARRVLCFLFVIDNKKNTITQRDKYKYG